MRSLGIPVAFSCAALVATAVMVDTDNTKAQATTYYGDIRFLTSR